MWCVCLSFIYCLLLEAGVFVVRVRLCVGFFVFRVVWRGRLDERAAVCVFFFNLWV